MKIIRMISQTYRIKLFKSGFNAIDCRMIGGRALICVMLYFGKYDKKLICVITSVPQHIDPFNTMLVTLEWGTKLKELELIGFFPDYKNSLKETKKKFPSHFRN